MKLRLLRIQNYNDYTIGALYIDNRLQCFVLEDEKREVKIKSETRIPRGLYKLRLQTSGTLHSRYSKIFPFHKGMLHVQNVPNFEGIMIHVGNTDEDTAGCLLVGTGHVVGQNMISNSRQAYSELYKIVSSALLKNDEVILHVVDELLG